jgi:hypothetical protein
MQFWGDSAPDQWSYDAAEVPEPMNAVLLISVMGLLGATRLRGKA